MSHLNNVDLEPDDTRRDAPLTAPADPCIKVSILPIRPELIRVIYQHDIFYGNFACCTF